MKPRPSILSLAFLLLATAAASAQDLAPIETIPAAPDALCGIALVDAEPLTLPALLEPATRTKQVTEHAFEVLRHDPGVAGARHVMIVIDAEIHPYLDVTKKFLQDRRNYPTPRDRDDAIELVDQFAKPLEAVFRELSEIQDAARSFNYMTLRFEQKGAARAPALAQKARYLHFGVLFAYERLVKATESWPEAFETARQIRIRLGQVDEFLRGIRAALDDANVDLELKMRLERLMEDVKNQTVLLDRVHDAIENRIRTSNVCQDNVRTLLTVRLPLAAVLGDARVDLSPLEPPGFNRLAFGPVSPSADSSGHAIDSVVDLVRKAKASRAQADILDRFVAAHAATLTVDDVLRLANSTWYAHVSDGALERFVAARDDLGANDLARLAPAARTEATRLKILGRPPAAPTWGRAGGGVIM